MHARFGCVLCGVSNHESILFHKTNQIVYFTAFRTPARLEVENGRIILVHKDHKFVRYGSNENTRFWRCCLSYKYHCEARVMTKIIRGREMLKIQNDQHEHNRFRIIVKAESQSV